MADYLPIYKPGQAITLQASATITGKQVLEVTGSGTVGPAGAASTKSVGVAAYDAVSGDKVTIYTGGVQVLTASGTVTAGDVVQCGAAGTAASGTTAPIGVALTTATTGNDVRVQLTR